MGSNQDPKRKPRSRNRQLPTHGARASHHISQSSPDQVHDSETPDPEPERVLVDLTKLQGHHKNSSSSSRRSASSAPGHSKYRSSGQVRHPGPPNPEPNSVLVDLTRTSIHHSNPSYSGHNGSALFSGGGTSSFAPSDPRGPLSADSWSSHYRPRRQGPSINVAAANSSSSGIHPQPGSYHTPRSGNQSSMGYSRVTPASISRTSPVYPLDQGGQSFHFDDVPSSMSRSISPDQWDSISNASSLDPSDSISCNGHEGEGYANRQRRHHGDDSPSGYSYRTDSTHARHERHENYRKGRATGYTANGPFK